jgi:hypothetical protein
MKLEGLSLQQATFLPLKAALEQLERTILTTASKTELVPMVIWICMS